jgi:hypothetical protein
MATPTVWPAATPDAYSPLPAFVVGMFLSPGPPGPPVEISQWPLFPLTGQLWPAGALGPVRRYVLQPDTLGGDFTVPVGFRMDTFGNFDINATLDVAGTYEAQ